LITMQRIIPPSQFEMGTFFQVLVKSFGVVFLMSVVAGQSACPVPETRLSII
jgi:hypothetical protein